MPHSPYRTPPSRSPEKNGEPGVALVVACGLVLWLAIHVGTHPRVQHLFEPTPADMNAHGGARGRR